MATKSKTAAVTAVPKDSAAKKHSAKCALNSGVNAAAVMDAYVAKTYGEIDFSQAVESLSDAMTEINGGNLRKVENMLFGQAQALQSIFVNLARKAANQEYLKQYETHLRLALKAQSQCRATLETLAAIKNPPVVFAKQANIAHGHQQINNGTAAPSHAKEVESDQTKLLEAQHGNCVDTTATCATISSDKEMAAVGAIDRAKISRR